MKRIAAIFATLAFGLAAMAQDDCTTTWPYIYSNFQKATIHMIGRPAQEESVNIHTLHSKLHFIDAKGMIQEMNLNKILVVELAGGDRYAVVDGSMMQMLVNKEKGFVGLRRLADIAALNETGGAYGTSSASSSTMKLSSVDVAGANVGHMEMLQHKHDGEALNLKETYYIVVGNNCCKASKKDIGDLAGAEHQNELKTFLKEHKIKWKDAESLSELIDLVAAWL